MGTGDATPSELGRAADCQARVAARRRPEVGAVLADPDITTLLHLRDLGSGTHSLWGLVVDCRLGPGATQTEMLQRLGRLQDAGFLRYQRVDHGTVRAVEIHLEPQEGKP